MNIHKEHLSFLFIAAERKMIKHCLWVTLLFFLLPVFILESVVAAGLSSYDLAYVAEDGGLWQLYLSDPRDGRKQQVTKSSVDLRNPTWAPHGKSIVYATRNGSLYLDALDGKSIEIPVPTIQNSEPSWSTDGTFIAYISYTNPRGYESELWKVGITEKNAFARADKVNIPSGLVTYPSCWRNTITYSRLEKVDYSGVIENICRIDLGTGVEMTLIADGFDNIHPAWSPDGKYLAYASNRQGNFDIWLWDEAKKTYTQLTSDPSMDQYPTWSPDGSSIGFSSSRSGSSQVWRIEVATGEVRQIGFGEHGSRDPAWRWSGK